MSVKRSAVDRDSVAETVSLLQQNASFAPLTLEQQARVVLRSPIEQAGPGHAFLKQGEVGTHAYLILDGQVSVEVDTEAGRVIVATLGPGNLVGEIAAFAATKRTASVISQTEVTMLRIEQATIQELLADSPETSVAIIGELGGRLQVLNGTIAALTQATKALAIGEFEPDMLKFLRREAGRFDQFAKVFEEMAQEIQKKHMVMREMLIASEIQQALLPKEIFAGPFDNRFDVCASMTPAKDVGGDFYDYFMIDEHTLGIALGDVSGKGVPAAIFMSVSRTALRIAAKQCSTAKETLSQVNSFLVDGNTESMFVTIVFGRLDLNTGRLTIANGGHEEVFLAPGSGVVTCPDISGPALGVIEHATYGEHVFDLDPATSVVLATDGISEAFNSDREMFGKTRLSDLIASFEGGYAKDLVDHIESAVSTFVGDNPQSDDLTCLVLYYRG